MFRISDGRTHFWQWDLDCKLVFEDSSITKVHFCNRTDECSLVCDVYEEGGQFLVDVPNILLQTDWDIHVYAYDSARTKHEDTFKVRPRSKPADYVYTETEIATWEKLEQRMDELESTVTTEGVEQAVSKYLEENPIEAGATEEEAAQIEANRIAIEGLQNEVTGFATEKYVIDAVSDLEAEIDNKGYLVESDLEGKGYITAIPDEYITENELSSKGFLTEHQSLEGYATEKYVDDAIANVPTGGGGTSVHDMNYATGVMAKSQMIDDVGYIWSFNDSNTQEEIIEHLESGHIIYNGSSNTVTFPSDSHTVAYKVNLDGSYVFGRTLSLQANNYAVKWAYNNYLYTVKEGLINPIGGIKKFFQNIKYDNSNSGLSAKTLPAAIDELKALFDSLTNGDEVSY